MKLKTFTSKWLPVLCWCGVIFYLSGMPATSASANKLIDHLLHDLAHVIEYGILLALLLRAFNEKASRLPEKSFLFLLFYALSDESHQYFVPTRSARLDDIFFDLLGGLIAWKSLQLILQRKQKN